MCEYKRARLVKEQGSAFFLKKSFIPLYKGCMNTVELVFLIPTDASGVKPKLPGD